MKKAEIKAILDRHNLTIESEFVPWSRSRNAKQPIPSLNWMVTVKYNGQKILTTDYMAGCGHCPSYQQRETLYSHGAVLQECEKGYKSSENFHMILKDFPILPDSVDVFYSLLIDSEVLEAGSLEEWAREFGYNEDSREAEKTYNACMKIALQFRKVGESVISELREAYQDY